jgi:hypothetical protein
MTTFVTVVIVCILLYLFTPSNSQTVKQDVSTNSLNEMGVNLMNDLKLKINNGESLKISSEYLKSFDIIVNEQFSLNDIISQIFKTKDEKIQELLTTYIIVLSHREEAEQPTYECKSEDSIKDINLFNDELMVKEWNVEWKEEKTVTTGITYGGVRMSGKGAFKGVFGHTNLIKHTKTDFQTVSHGILYLTSKRLIFVGKNKTKTIRLDRVLNVEVFQDSVFINKENGNSPMIVPTGLWEDSVEIGKYITRVVFDDVELVVK